VTTKRAQERLVPIPAPAVAALRTWRLQCPPSPWAFPSGRDPEKAVEARQVTRTIHRYAAAAGIERRVYVHLLRDSYATILADAGTPTETIQRALGHASITTTAGYISRLGAFGRVRSAQFIAFGSRLAA
jgi:integrase/recombinase XerD